MTTALESPYLTSAEASAYLKFSTVRAFYEWLRRHPEFPRSRRGSHTLLFEKRICDAYLRGELRLRHTKSSYKSVAEV